MRSLADSRFGAWIDAQVDATPLRRLRFAFALVWLLHDAIDLAIGGSASCLSLVRDVSGLAALQAALVVVELALLTGRRARLFLLLAALLRGYEAYAYWRLNDFYYFTLTAALLALSDCDRRTLVTPRWSRDVLRWQTGWIYLATAMMKLNPEFLSGGHLYVRQSYALAALHWPYPAIYQRCIASMPCEAALSWTGVLAEVTLGTLLMLGRGRWIALALAAGIHAFGLLATNVWFFGPSIVLQVFFVMAPAATGALRAPPGSRRASGSGRRARETRPA